MLKHHLLEILETLQMLQVHKGCRVMTLIHRANKRGAHKQHQWLAFSA